MLKLVDLAAIAAIGRRHDIWTTADNTFASPFVQRPLDHGFSAVVHSTTKYLNGHSDVIGGMAIIGEDRKLAERLGFLQNPWAAFPDHSTVFSSCAGSKRWRYGWSAIAPTHWRSQNRWSGIPRSDGRFIPDLARILSTCWRAAR